MATAYRFISDPAQPSEVLTWFRNLPVPPSETITPRSIVLHFRELGPLTEAPDGSIDGKASPVVTFFSPRVRRGILWTVGEVHFLPTPLRKRYPVLHEISASFSKWLSTFPCVFSNKTNDNEYNYYLEGSVKNFDPPVYAFESGLKALKAQRYFVSDEDTDARLNDLCKALRLRGVNCGV
jgi:hypothetical protein